jgi:hypothetical protein
MQQADGAGPVRQAFDPATLLELSQQAKDAGLGAGLKGDAKFLDAGHRPGLGQMGLNRVETLTLPGRQARAGGTGFL